MSIYEINNKQNRNSKFIGFPGLIDRNWNPASDWSCITGNAQIEFFLRSFFEISYNKKLLDVADKLAFELKSIQVLGENISEKNEGRIFGSDPINGEYDKFNIPNWGVKFYADTISKEKLSRRRFILYRIRMSKKLLKKKILIAFGTRPELIKLLSLIIELRSNKKYVVYLCKIINIKNY